MLPSERSKVVHGLLFGQWAVARHFRYQFPSVLALSSIPLAFVYEYTSVSSTQSLGRVLWEMGLVGVLRS